MVSSLLPDNLEQVLDGTGSERSSASAWTYKTRVRTLSCVRKHPPHYPKEVTAILSGNMAKDGNVDLGFRIMKKFLKSHERHAPLGPFPCFVFL